MAQYSHGPIKSWPYTVMALYSHGPICNGPYSYDLYSYGLYSYGPAIPRPMPSARGCVCACTCIPACVFACVRHLCAPSLTLCHAANLHAHVRACVKARDRAWVRTRRHAMSMRQAEVTAENAYNWTKGEVIYGSGNAIHSRTRARARAHARAHACTQRHGVLACDSEEP